MDADEPTRVVYILGLSRSGSTFLQFLLASHPRVVGVGEISHTINRYVSRIRPDREHVCSCGQEATACPAWGPILPELPALEPTTAHRHILRHFAATYPGQILLDSSKTREGLGYYRERGAGGRQLAVDLRVLCMVRDFRGWTLSVDKARRRRGLPERKHLRTCYQWLYANARNLVLLERARIDYLFLSYENLVFDMARELVRIGAFLGVDLAAADLDMSRAEHHDLFGNPMKRDPGRSTRVAYDDTWKSSWRPGAALPLLAPIYAVNRVSQMTRWSHEPGRVTSKRRSGARPRGET
jgi:hypothetical protein